MAANWRRIACQVRKNPRSNTEARMQRKHLAVTITFQRTVTNPLTPCLSPGVHSSLMDLLGAPSPELSTAVQQYFHQTEHAGVVDLDAGDFAVACGDRKSQALEQWEVDVDIESLSFEGSETIGNASQRLPHGFQVV